MAEEIKRYLAHQPILDAQHKIVAYELFFRADASDSATVTDSLVASANVMSDVLSNFDLQQLLGDHIGFINVNQDILMSSMVELLPKSRFVLELLPTVPANAATLIRCKELKDKGFALALGDSALAGQHLPLLEQARYVKIDLSGIGAAGLAALASRLQALPQLTLVAEKVETQAQFDTCRQLGFHLFQGYYFARPALLERKRIDPARSALFRLMEQIQADESMRALEKTVQEHPDLAVKLLRLVKSAGIGGRIEIDSIRQALVVLGQRQLQNWVQLLLYAMNKEAHAGPLMILAARRARFMELLADPYVSGSVHFDVVGGAYMVGVLSLAEALLGIPLAELLAQINLAAPIKDAMLGYKGYLGSLLRLAIAAEEGDFATYDELLPALGISAGKLEECHLEALRWSEKLAYA